MAKTKYAKGDTVNRFGTYGYVQEYLGSGNYRVFQLATYFTTQEHAVRSHIYRARDLDAVSMDEFKDVLKNQLATSTPLIRLLHAFKTGRFDTVRVVKEIKFIIKQDHKVLDYTLSNLNKTANTLVPTLEELDELSVTNFWRNISDLKAENENVRRRAA